MSIASSPIEYALHKLTMSVPRQILELTFFPASEHRTTDATNLNQRIRERVIDSIVMADMNKLGGVAVPLDIQQSWMKILSPVIALIDVPMNVTQNRPITSALNSSFGVNMINNAAIGIANQGNQMLTGANRVFNSAKAPPYVGTPDVRVIGTNQLEIRNFVSIPVRIRGLVRIQYTKDFNELRNAYHDHFADIVEMAVKAYCYNNMIVPMDRAQLQGGMELGRLSSKIEEWSDIYETYKETLTEKWRRILIMNDPILSNRDIKMKVNP